MCKYVCMCVFVQLCARMRDVNGRLNGRRGNQVTVDSGLMRCSGRCQQRDRGSPHLCSAPAHTTHTNYGGGEGVRGRCHRREGPYRFTATTFSFVGEDALKNVMNPSGWRFSPVLCCSYKERAQRLGRGGKSPKIGEGREEPKDWRGEGRGLLNSTIQNLLHIPRRRSPIVLSK